MIKRQLQVYPTIHRNLNYQKITSFFEFVVNKCVVGYPLIVDIGLVVEKFTCVVHPQLCWLCSFVED